MSTTEALRVRSRAPTPIRVAIIGAFVVVVVSLHWQSRLAQAEGSQEVDWVRHAKAASTEFPRNKAALYWLKAASVQPSPDTFLQLRRVWSGSLPNIIATFTHGGRAKHASFSPDGLRVVTACDDSYVRVWDIATGRQLWKSMKQESKIEYAAFTPDGKRIVSVDFSGTACVWDAATGSLMSTPKEWESGEEIYVEFSRDGSRVAANGKDRKVRVWDSLTGEQIGKTIEADEKLFHPVFSQDGKRIVTVSPDEMASVWDVMTGEELGDSINHVGVFQYPGFSNDGQRLYTHFRPRAEILIWDVTTGKQVGRPLPHAHNVIGVDFSPDDRKIATACMDGAARVWDVETGALLGAVRHRDGVQQVDFSVDGQHIATRSHDSARIWRVETAQPVTGPLRDAASHVGFSPDGSRLISAGVDVNIREIVNKQPFGKSISQGSSYAVAAISPDGWYVVTACDDGNARLWDVATGAPSGQPLKHGAAVHFVGFSADGQWIVTASRDKTARVWKTATTEPVTPPLKHKTDVSYAVFSPDGRTLVTAYDKEEATIWDIGTGQKSVVKQEGGVDFLVFSPAGDRFVAAGWGRQAMVWETKSGQRAAGPLAHSISVKRAAFSPDGKRIVTASDDDSARIWDAATGQAVSEPLKHDYYVGIAEFSFDGERVVTGSSDCTAKVWDVANGQPIGDPLKHGEFVHFATFSRDGRRIITTSGNVHGRERISADCLHWWIEETPGHWVPEATVWSQGPCWKSPPRILNDSGTEVMISDGWTDDTLIVRRLSPHSAEEGLPEFTGKPNELLEEYSRRFALKFEDVEGVPTLKPLYPVSTADVQGTVP